MTMEIQGMMQPSNLIAEVNELSGGWRMKLLLASVARAAEELQQLTDEIEHRISFDSLDDISRHLYD